MRDNLTEANRERFFLSVIEKLTEAEVKVIVAIDDKNCSVANSSEDGSAAAYPRARCDVLAFRENQSVTPEPQRGRNRYQRSAIRTGE